ncbi:hypothetical protein ACFC3Z_12195 [Enterococcus thailandicus]|uniref:hypothetical protein n=1 Tax=Enterococcus thailandicus TaxID=417368 RepID=UPI0035D59566
MYFTISAENKLGKKLLKEAEKQKKTRSSFIKNNKYSVSETEEQLHVLGEILEQKKLDKIEITLNLYDTEGKIESAGTIYMIGPLNYEVSEGFYPTLIDLIRVDLYKETDETMSAEESYRNEKLISVLENELDQTAESKMEKDNSKIAPWERPIKEEPEQVLKEVEQTIEDKKVSQFSKEDIDFTVFDDEEDIEENNDENPFLVNDENIQEENNIQEMHVEMETNNHLFDWTTKDSQTYIEPNLNEEVKENKKAIEKATTFEFILEQYPPEFSWMAQKTKLFLNELYAKYQLPQTYQAFIEGQQELISEGKGMLIEQLESVKSTNWVDLAQEDLTTSFEERQTEVEQDIATYAEEQAQLWEKKKEELSIEEQNEIEEQVRKIKNKYEQKRDQAFSLSKEKIDQFALSNRQDLEIEKDNLLNERVNELKLNYHEGLQSDKVRINSELNDRLIQLYHATKESLTERQEQIQNDLVEQISKWKIEHEKLQQDQKITEEKRMQEETQKKQNEIREKELEIEQQKLQIEEEKNKANRKDRKEQLEMLRQAQLNQFMQPATKEIPVEKVVSPSIPAQHTSINGWMVGCIASISLFLGGGAAFAYSHVNQQSSDATVSAIKEQASEQARREYEEKLQELLSNTAQATNHTEDTSEQITSQSQESSQDSKPSEEPDNNNTTISSSTLESSQSNEVK